MGKKPENIPDKEPEITSIPDVVIPKIEPTTSQVFESKSTPISNSNSKNQNYFRIGWYWVNNYNCCRNFIF